MLILKVSIFDFFDDLHDPRQPGKNLYPLKEIILIALCAAICGADSFVKLEAAS